MLPLGKDVGGCIVWHAMGSIMSFQSSFCIRATFWHETCDVNRSWEIKSVNAKESQVDEKNETKPTFGNIFEKESQIWNGNTIYSFTSSVPLFVVTKVLITENCIQDVVTSVFQPDKVYACLQCPLIFLLLTDCKRCFSVPCTLLVFASRKIKCKVSKASHHLIPPYWLDLCAYRYMWH